MNEFVVWASGIGGTYVRTTDGGEIWTATVVPGADSLQFLDVEAIDADGDTVMYVGTDSAGEGRDGSVAEI